MSTSIVNAQKVALVLSGGGAKGIAHVGVLKALEENEIPIDFIVGTSMGGIVGGAYAAGFSPQQIEAMVLSEEFLRWVTGQPEKGSNFHYYTPEATPDFLRLNLSLDSARTFQFNTSFTNDASLNFALTDKIGAASSVSQNNFDSLFVPFRVVAADIFSQNQVILSKGSLSEALRATQTVPFVYTPIRVEGKYLFDGGVYNNFPVDVAEREFSPEVIIGSNVSSKIYNEYPYDDDDNLISRSLIYMLLDKSNPEAIPETGIYIQPDLKPYTAFDFSRAKAMIDSGYWQTIRQLDEIRRKIGARKSVTYVNQLRSEFRAKTKPIIADKLEFRNFSIQQQKYIRRIFDLHSDQTRPLTLEEVKEGYFKLVAEPYFNNIFPTIKYIPKETSYVLQLTRRPQKNFQVDFGGVLATRNISNIYLGLNYYYFRNALTHVYLGLQTGSFYKSFVANTRIDLPYLGRFYIQPEVVYNDWDFIESTDLLQKSTPTVLKRFDRKLGVSFGWPLGDEIKSDFSFSGFTNSDRYSNSKSFNSLDTLDNLSLDGYKTGLRLTVNDLNRKQYASLGKSYSLSVYYFHVRENYKPGTTSVSPDPVARDHQWFRLRATAEHYFSRGSFRPGFYADVVFSNQPFFQNYFGTIINTPAFYPIQDSRTLILENFRSTNYLALGARNVIVVRPRTLDIRVEGYLFKPLEYIQEGQNQEAYTNTSLTTLFFAGSTSLVYHSPIGPVSLSANYYDDAENKFGVLLHVGFLLFNRHTLEN
ncbi:MAG: patatin-like phospholipase family protein [Cyclobacteriaceae bacterium]|nr:patatin-like phospholipase family protein [Cyclobacteriaceae bacterium]